MNHTTGTRLATAAMVAAAAAGGGLLTFHLYGNTAQVAELAGAALAGAGAFKLIASSRARDSGFVEAGGVALSWAAIGLGAAGLAGWGGGGMWSVWATMAAAGAGFAMDFAWKHHQRHDVLNQHHKNVQITNAAGQARLAELREEMALLRLKQQYDKLAPVTNGPVEPSFAGGLSGQVQRAVWVASSKKAVIDPPLVTQEPHGWVAELTMRKSGWDRQKLTRAVGVVGQEIGGLRRALEVLPSDSEDAVRLRYREPGSWPSEVPFRASFLGERWGAPVQVGIDEWGDNIELLLNIHSIIAGATNFGKSTLINSIIVQLASREHVSVVGVDMKPYAPEFTPLKPALGRLLTTLDEAHEWIDWIIDEMYSRGEIMAREGVKKWDPTKPWAKGRPVTHTFFDEYAEAIRQETALGTKKGERIQDKVETVLAMARAYGLYLHLCTQQPSAKMFGDDTGPRGNCPIRVAFHMSESNHDRFVLSPGWATKVLGGQPGRFVMMSPKHSDPEPYMGYWLSDAELAVVIATLANGGMVTSAPQAVVTLSKQELEEKVEAVAKLTRSQAAEAIMLELAMGPATKGGLKSSLGDSVNNSTIKNALWKLKQDGAVEYDQESELWRLV